MGCGHAERVRVMETGVQVGEQSKGVKKQAEGGVFLQEGVRGGKRVGKGGVRRGGMSYR